jgi:K+-transporting ATPase ATPase C chain
MKSLNTAFRVFVLFSLITGGFYPWVVTIIAQNVFPQKANGSLLYKNQSPIGSELLSQSFKDPKYFWPRPSAVNFNPLPSGASNFGMTSQDLKSKVDEQKAKGIFGELLFASGSGLDPHISPAAAFSQVERVARHRQMDPLRLSTLVQKMTEDRQWGFLGEPRVNVLKLNLELDSL